MRYCRFRSRCCLWTLALLTASSLGFGQAATDHEVKAGATSTPQAPALPPVTTLTVQPNPASAGEVVTLTATVTTNGMPVPVGTVTFSNGKQALGTVQMVKASGTATLRTRFAPGMYSLVAHYNANNLFGASQSPFEPLTVTGTEPTISTLSATPDGSNYDFTASVFGFGFPVPTGSASFTDLTTMTNLGSVGIAGPGALSFYNPGLLSAGGNAPVSVAIGDFNGDGFPDLAITNVNDETVSVFLGNGDGTFQAQQIVPVGGGSDTYGIAVGDFNADGRLDIAVGTVGRFGDVRVLLGNGDGTFQAPQVYKVGGEGPEFAIAVGDFNGDGALDLVVGLQNAQAVVVLLNNGDGTFTEQQPAMTVSAPSSIAVGDFNHDGLLDVAVVNTVFNGILGNSVSVFLGNGDGTLQPQTEYSVGVGPRGIAIGDFNGDGSLDLAVPNTLAEKASISVLLGNPDGTFQPQQTYSTLPYETDGGIAVGDFNGDGIPDLAAGSGQSAIVEVLLGVGDGTFQPPQTYNAVQASSFGATAVADLNGDGVPDIAIATFTNGHAAVILLGGTVTTGTLKNVPVPGVGGQTIQSAFTPGSGAPPGPPFYAGSLSNIVQVNGNGMQIPTATTVSSSQNPSSYMQPVTFTATVTAVGGGSPTGTVEFLADKVDIPGCAKVPLNQIQNGSTATCMIATLQPGGHSIVANYSGDANFVPSQSLAFQQNVNMAATTTALTANPPSPSGFGQPVTFTATVTGAFGGSPGGTVDFTDNKLPIAGCKGVALVPQPNGSTASCTTAALAIGLHTIAGNYNGDDPDDLFFPSNGSIPYAVLAATATTLAVAPPSPVAAGQVVTLTATVTSNGDPVFFGTVTFSNGKQVLGTVQLVKVSGTATLKTRFGPGMYSFTARFNHTNEFASSISAAQPYTVTGTEPTISTLSATPDGSNYDFTLSVFGFGFPPLSGSAALNNLTQGGSLLGTIQLPGPGMSTFQPQQTYAAGDLPYGVAVADLNGDGFPDLAIGNANNGQVTVLLAKGDGTFRPQQSYFAGGDPLFVAVGDFNGDGIPDLAATSALDNTASILLGKGDGTFQPAQAYGVGKAPNGLVTADFNGDGIADLVIANGGSGTASVLLGNGDGTFQPQQTYPVGNTPIEVVAADFNRDGIPDLAIVNSDDSTVSVLLGNGDGTFQPQQTYLTGGFPFGVATADFNADGIADLAITNAGDNTVSVLLGKGDGTFQQQTTFPTGGEPIGIAVADFNGDGFADLAVANFVATTVSVLAGNGDGTFQPQQTYQAGSGLGQGPAGVVAADLNGDGVPDLAAANSGDNTVSILLGGTVNTGQLNNIPVCGVGNQNIQSTYTSDGIFYAGSLSNVVTVVGGCGQIPTTTAVSSSQNPSSYLQPVTFTATVTAVGGGSPTGTMTFTADKIVIPGCAAIPLVAMNNGSSATCSTATLTAGAHCIVGSYSGDNNFAPSQSPCFSQNVNQAATTTVLTASPPSPSNFGQQVTFTATLTGANGGSPTGTVDFTDNKTPIPGCTGVKLAPQQNGSTATCQTASLAVGLHTITATYNGDGNFTPSVGAIPYTVVAGDFSLLPISPGNATVTQGFNNTNDPFFAQTINLTVQPVNGYNGTVTLSCSLSPPLAGGTCVVNPPNSGSLAGGNLATTLTISAGSLTPIGSYTVTVTAQDNSGLAHFTTLALKVVDYAPPIKVLPGGGGMTPVSFNGPAGGSVGNLSCPLVTGTGISGSEDLGKIGGVCTFSSGSVTLPGSVIVTISGCTVARLRTGTRILATLWLGIPGGLLLGCLRISRTPRKRILQVAGTLLLLLALLMGVSCGGGSGQLTPTGNYLVLVQGTGSDGIVYSAVVPVTVTQSGQ